MYDPSRYNPAGRFTGLSNLYKSGRPSYSPAAVDYILQRCALNKHSSLADIGCGTGISSRLFAERGLAVIGVDPNDDMLNEARSSVCEKGTAPEYLKGSAEETGLERCSVDAVLCAQAFHWFNPDKALSEFHRITKPGGWVVLMWNEREEQDSFTAFYGDLMRRYADDTCLEVKRAEAGDVVFHSALFTDAAIERFPNQQMLDRERLMARAFSTSYAPPAASASGANLAGELEALLARYRSEDGNVIMRYVCSIYTARRP